MLRWRQMTAPTLEAADLASRVTEALSDHQAEEIVMLDIRQVAGFTDYFVIATAANVRHMRALLDAVEADLKRAGVAPHRTEGQADSGWVLMDYGDVIVHLFSPEERAFYNLEGLWGRAGVPIVRFQ
jgi:ribosome-associated protein